MQNNESGSTRQPVRQVQVDTGHAGQRIDNFLLALLRGVPRSHVYRLLRQGQVRVNKKRVRPLHRLQAGDVVRIPPLASRVETRTALPRPDPRLCERIAAAIVHEEADLLVLDKPAGIAVHGGSGLRYGLIEVLRELRPECPDIALVHRLDRDTSGCLLIAKDRALLPALQRLFRDGRVEKRYLTLVRGRWAGGARAVSLALQRGAQRSGERLVQVDTAGKPAETVFVPLQLYERASLMDVRLKTGRTHQIRVHAASLGHPVAGDTKYGDPDFNRALRRLGLRRLFLHAHALAFEHPRDGHPVAVSTPLPEALRQVVERLEGADGGVPV